MQPLNTLHSRTAVLAHENIDTDRIIPARFLTTTECAGLGRYAFNDWRYRADGSDDPDFELNCPEVRGCEILVAGRNFGCGSSREHAPWALLDFGIRAVISSEIADIFRSNALKNGLLAIVVGRATHRWLLDNPGTLLSIDVGGRFLALANDVRVSFDLDAFSRHCLLEGIDQLDFLEQQRGAIKQYEQRKEQAA